MRTCSSNTTQNWMHCGQPTGRRPVRGPFTSWGQSEGISNCWNVPWKQNKWQIQTHTEQNSLQQYKGMGSSLSLFKQRSCPSAIEKLQFDSAIWVASSWNMYFLFALLNLVQLTGSSVRSRDEALHKKNSTLGWMVGSWRETEIEGQTPRGAQYKPVFPVSRCRANKRCPLNKTFSGKNSFTRFTRNAVICKAFPAKRFISCPWGKRKLLFYLTLTHWLMFALSSSFLHLLHVCTSGGHNDRNEPCNKSF